MHSNTFAASVLATASLLTTTIAKPIFNPTVISSVAGTANPQLAVYWGQGPGQKRLSEFCQDTTMDIIPIGFVNIFPDQENGPGNNYGNACGSDLWVTPGGQQTQMLTECSQIAEDIKTCQAAGKKIFASIGGAEPGGNFLASQASAAAFADFLWGSFGPLQDSTLKQYPRPFGTDTIVDGFDLDIESGPDSYYSDLVNELRAKFATSTGTYYISAAPQCVVPDAHLDEAIQNSSIDYLFIQFYNTDSCSAASLFSSGTLNTNTDVTFGWLQWLTDNSQNKNIKIFLGLPASTTAAHSQDYLNIANAKALIQEYACDDKYSASFGGVMLWDATYSDQNTDADLNGQSYAYNIKQIFGQLSCTQPPQTTTTTTWTTTTTTTWTTTTTTTTPVVPTTTTTTTTTPVAPTSTTTSTWTTTTTSVYVPETTTTTSPAAETTTTYSHPGEGPTSWSTSTTSSYSPVGPIGGSSSTSTTTTTTYSYPVEVETTSTSSPAAVTSTTSYYWGDWTSSSSKPVDAATTSSSTTSSFDWADWESSKTSSSTKPVDAVTTTTSSFDWADWEASKTSSTTKPVDPASTSSFDWSDWEASKTSSTKPVDAAKTTSSSFDWADWEASQTTSYSVIMTQTVVPVKPTDGAAAVDHSSGPFGGWTGPSYVVSTAVKPAETSVAAASTSTGWAYTPSKSLTSVAAASTSGSLTTPVAPATFTGGAAQQELPGTVMSVAVCVVVAVVGLFL